MTAKTGIPTLHRVARMLCKYLTRFSTGIGLLFPDNGALLAALAAASSACAVLEAELAAVRDYGD